MNFFQLLSIFLHCFDLSHRDDQRDVKIIPKSSNNLEKQQKRQWQKDGKKLAHGLYTIVC